MRRNDREITDFDGIINIIDSCEILRIGLSDGEYPYIVPVNFAYSVEENKIFFYFHGAQAGRKYELLRKNGVCSFECDIPLGIKLSREKSSATMRYRSVMGKARAEFLEGQKKYEALDMLMARSPITRDFEYNKETVSRTAVIRLEVTEIAAKANI